MVYTREEFNQAIKEIERTWRFAEAVGAAAKAAGSDYWVEWYPPTCDTELCRALEAMFNDTTESVSWYCFEKDFGREYHEGDNMVGDQEWPLRNVDELYDYLVAMMEQKD